MLLTLMRADLVRVGAMVLIGIALIAVGLQFLRARFSDSGHYLLKVRFADARSVGTGASVLMAGVPIGFVRGVDLVGSPPVAELTLAIREGIQIPTGSTFRIAGGTLLPTEARVEVIPPAQSVGFIAPNSTLDGESPIDFNSALSRLTPEVERTLQELQGTLQAVRALLEDQQLRTAVVDTLEGVQLVTTRMERLLRTVDGVVVENRRGIRQLLAEANATTRELRKAVASANRLLSDPQTQEDLRATLANIRSTTERAETLLSEVEQLVGDPELQSNIRDTTQNVRTLSEKANNLADKAGDVLERSDQLVQNLNETVTEVRPTLREAGDTLQRVNKALETALSARTFGIQDATYRLEMGYNTESERYRTDLVATLFLTGERTLTLGLYDFTERDRLIAQYGTPINSNLFLRYGIYASKPGFGVDLRLGEQGTVSFDLFDPNDWQGHLRLNWRVSGNLFLWGGLESPFRRNQPAFGIRIER
ncbi:MAG: MlaD family protein [Fimbriimonadales bacterium]